MNFAQAFAAFLEGKDIRRTSWPEGAKLRVHTGIVSSDKYLAGEGLLIDGIPAKFYLINDEAQQLNPQIAVNIDGESWPFDAAHILATDWEVL